MKATFDVEKIKKLLKDFFTCTNITVTLFDGDLNYITDAGKRQPFCYEMEKNPSLNNECDVCNKCYLKRAKELRSTLTYTCHAGIVESITPIFYDGMVIAYLMMGKFRDNEKMYSSEKLVIAACKKYGLDEDTMLDYYHKLPIYDKKYIDAAISMLAMCICFIGYENYIHYDKRYLHIKIADYIKEHLSETITVDDLCNEFNVPRYILYKMFKTENNCSIKQYILDKKLQAALDLLKNTDMSVGNIAIQVGFSDYNYFIQFFKSRMNGITPYQYRVKSKEVK